MQDRFYIVVAGEAGISAQIGGRDVSLNTAQSGDCIGELNLLEPGPASATVRVTKDATLWSMDAEQLRAYLFEHTGGAGALLMGMAHCLSKRIRGANQLIAQNHVCPLETLPAGRERAITAENTPVQLGFFDRPPQIAYRHEEGPHLDEDQDVESGATRGPVKRTPQQAPGHFGRRSETERKIEASFEEFGPRDINSTPEETRSSES